MTSYFSAEKGLGDDRGLHAPSATSKWTTFVASAFFGVTCAFASGSAPDVLEGVHKTSGDWIKVRAETVRLEADWETEHALLDSTLAELKQRIADAKEKREYAVSKAAENRGDLDKLIAKNKAEADELAQANKRLQGLTSQLLALRPNLPPRLADALEMPYRTLASKQFGESERIQTATTILTRIVQFNRMVSTAEEILRFDGESVPKSVETIYWGLAQGYAVDRASGKAWIGMPGAEQWEWRVHSELAKEVAHLIDVSRDKAEPTLTPLLAQLKHTEAAKQTH